MKILKSYRLEEKTIQALESISEKENLSMSSVIQMLVTARAFKTLSIEELDTIYGQSCVDDVLELKKIEQLKRA